MKNEIDVLREKLYELVRNNASFQQIYKISVKLDELIVSYHKKMMPHNSKSA